MDKLKINYEILELHFGDYHWSYYYGKNLHEFCLEPVVSVKTYGQKTLSKDETHAVVRTELTFMFDPIGFKKYFGRDWDGTRKGLQKHKDLEGKVIQLQLLTNEETF